MDKVQSVIKRMRACVSSDTESSRSSMAEDRARDLVGASVVDSKDSARSQVSDAPQPIAGKEKVCRIRHRCHISDVKLAESHRVATHLENLE